MTQNLLCKGITRCRTWVQKTTQRQLQIRKTPDLSFDFPSDFCTVAKRVNLRRFVADTIILQL